MCWVLKLPEFFASSHNAVCVQSRGFQRKIPQLQLFTSVNCTSWGHLLTLLFVQQARQRQMLGCRVLRSISLPSQVPPQSRPAGFPKRGISVHCRWPSTGWHCCVERNNQLHLITPWCAVCGPSLTFAVHQHPSSLKMCICLVLCRLFHLCPLGPFDHQCLFWLHYFPILFEAGVLS